MGTKALTFCLSSAEQCWWGWRALQGTVMLPPLPTNLCLSSASNAAALEYPRRVTPQGSGAKTPLFF